MGNLDGKTTFITGGGQGIGRGIALEMAKAGANVIIAQRSDKAKIVVDEIKMLGRDAIAVNMDVTDFNSIQKGVNTSFKYFSRIEILVNCAGVAIVEKGLDDASSEGFDLCYAVNLKGVWGVCKAMIPHFRENHGGKIVNIASIAGRRGSAGGEAYSVSKAGLINLTQSLACSLSFDNVNVNAVCPGVIKTAMTERQKKEFKKNDYFDNFKNMTLLKRLPTPSDIGYAVVFFRHNKQTISQDNRSMWIVAIV